MLPGLSSRLTMKTSDTPGHCFLYLTKVQRYKKLSKRKGLFLLIFYTSTL